MIDSFALALAGVGAVIWLVRLEGRINSHDTLFAERKGQQEDRHNSIIDRLERIEAKIDKQNGHKP